MRILITLAFMISFLLSNAQQNQGEYLESKRQFNLGNYRDAMGGFQGLSSDPVFGKHASFYYALSAYYQEMPKVAIDMWKQILRKYPTWNQNKEVHFWLAKTSFQTDRYLEGLKHASKLTEQQKQSLISRSLTNADITKLAGSYKANNEDKDLASFYFQALGALPYETRDNATLLELSKKFGFELADTINDFPKVKKDKYGIALVLPFMFDSLQNPQSVISNRIIFELYQGMLLAKDSLSAVGVELDFFPYDTHKLGSKAYEITQEQSLKDADLIIGPLYTDPSKILSSFSVEHEIPMINPLSSYGSLIEDNKYAYLFKPAYETQGRIAGEYATKNFNKNKNAMIFFESVRDQAVAEAYKKVLERDSFNIVLFDEITKEGALQLQHDFTDQYESSLDSLSQDDIDSIALIPNRYVRSKPKRDESTGRILKDQEGEDRLEYYEMRYTIPLDTIGHIFAATTSNLLSNNIISLTESRGDSIKVLGYDSWLDFRLVSYNQLQRLGVTLIHTNYFDEEASEIIEDQVRRVFWNDATKYHKIGFELIMQIGSLLDQHGKYFQRGLLTDEFYEGYLMKGLRYGIYQDNQVVPIVKIEDLSIRVQNDEDED